VGVLVAALREPVHAVRLAGIAADLDRLLLAEHAGGDPRVDPIGEPRVALLLRLDDRRGVDPGRGAKCVAAGQRVLGMDRDMGRARGGLAPLDELGQIVIRQLAEQLQVEQDLIERGVADPLADAERGAMDAIGTELDREDRVDDAEATIVVAVPVDPDLQSQLSSKKVLAGLTVSGDVAPVLVMTRVNLYPVVYNHAFTMFWAGTRIAKQKAWRPGVF
jgi:hypothetical protein